MHITTWRSPEDIVLREVSHTQQNKQCIYMYLHEVPRMITVIKADSRTVVTRALRSDGLGQRERGHRRI